MKRIFVMVAASAALLGATATAATATPKSDVRTTLQQDANAIVRQGSPGVLAELSTTHGSTTVRAGFGNTTTKEPVPRNAKFRIGSFTKTFVATTVLQLVGEGKVALDAPIEKYLPGTVKNGKNITVRQLLQHTSGLADYLAAPEFAFLGDREAFEKGRVRDFTAEELVALGMKQKPLFAPGTSWQYSNTNYALAGLLIEKVTGDDWRDQVNERIVRRLGLTDTTAPGTDHSVPDPHAVGYERFPGAGATPEDPRYGEPIDATELSSTWGDAAGEIISTTKDGNRFLRALLSGKLLKPAQLAEMKKTVAAKPFQAIWPGARYGLGLMSSTSPCGLIWGHGGDILGYKTRNGASENGTRSVIVSMNTDSLKPLPGAPKLTTDVSVPLIQHAICS
ncbi:serine hydrolase domain-containing protein [Cryptosporangium arvum]|uniref:serine hydrolase domain-containing protein n=1 Tax=Cryptosporangium arvum TaxID=80871 RepID=UPI000566BA39|nr:serine hydrolase domain-containing protein [Cryptosporangium arvum]